MNDYETKLPEGAANQPRLVRLIQCVRRPCGYVLTEDERDWEPQRSGGRLAVCPACGGSSFYTLKENGQATTWSERDRYRNGIDPLLIEPGPRMGVKKKNAILAAKRRILEANADRKSLIAHPMNLAIRLTNTNPYPVSYYLGVGHDAKTEERQWRCGQDGWCSELKKVDNSDNDPEGDDLFHGIGLYPRDGHTVHIFFRYQPGIHITIAEAPSAPQPTL